ncbi:protein lifeguard 1 [Cyclospora cayetanensis]|uniref:Transmembrane bax inhibitor motif-containing protein n=2 Tax=Cyclospora cayetanensis TaxID=88456 RepID=A0A1D3D3W7_9EIME|nr:protein lifeguard 1 [Cyclospora cayetanensis]OEH78137.1 transmembrane bax inhibitor motif-containing protein [Cyclospora cayetanensis]
MAQHQDPNQQPFPQAYGHQGPREPPAYPAGPPPPAAAYGVAGGYPGNNQQGNAYAAQYGGAPYPATYGGPYAGMPPPYPPAAPAYAGAPAGVYPYAQQTPVYGKATNSVPSSMEMGGLPRHPSAMAEDKITEESSIEIRHAFLRKVLGILAIQILFTFGVSSVFGFVPALRSFLLNNYWLAIVAAIGGLVLQLVLVCVPNLARKVPANFMLMTLITFCYAILLSCAAAASSWQAFLIAIGSTFVVVVGLMLFACQTKYDFTGCGTYLFVAMMCLLIFGILCIFFTNRVMHLVYSSIATLLFCLILLVVGGKHRRYQYSIDDYIFAALTLYMDIIIIFMNILAIADNS